MTKQELLKLMRLLSALESASLTRDAPFPDYLYDHLAACSEILEREILK